MRRFGFMAVVFAVYSGIAAEGVRNPFWPEGYQGEFTPISAEPRVKPKPEAAVVPKVEPEKELTGKKAAAEAKVRAEAEARAKAAAAKAAAEAAARAAREAELRRAIVKEDWIKARRALKVGCPAVFKSESGVVRYSVSINGNIYVDGDLVSVTHDNIRFTWRVKGLDGKESLKLVRVKARRLDPEAKKAGEK